MKRFLLFTSIVCLTVAPVSALPNTIIVDGGGGGDYLTIQEGVDVASSGDTVLVCPGTYTDTHYSWCCDGPVNVCIEQSLTLMSRDGPEVTVIDGGSVTTFSVISNFANDVVVEGFTVLNAGWFDWWGAGICVTDGEVRGNVCTDCYVGITDSPYWYTGSSSEESARRGRGLVVADNKLEGNEMGIDVRFGGVVMGNTLEGNVAGIAFRSGGTVTDNTLVGNASGILGGGDTVVSGNSVSGGQVGIGVTRPWGTSVVGNEISGNTKGVTVRNPSHSGGAHFSLDLQSNLIVDNTERNIEIRMWDVEPGPECDMVIGGSVDGANDIYGALVNLYVETDDVELRLDATYNFWGSVACSTFVPLFDIHEDFPDTGLVFEPFVDETHTKVFEECEGVPVEHQSWGAIKALYR